MPFLAPLIPAIAGGAASAAVGAGVNAIAQGSQQKPTAAPVNNAVNQYNTNAVQNTEQGAENQQGALANALAAQNGIGNQSQVYGQQQQLAGTLQNIVNGGGPNPALAQLQQTTGQNVSNQAALMAGQRGAGTNAGLIAREAGQQGAATQQQAVGQAATLEQQQQLNAIGALQNQQSNLAGLASQQVNQQANATSNLNNFALQNQNQILNANQAQNQLAAGQQANVNTINSQYGLQNSGNLQSSLGGAAQGVGAGVTALATPQAQQPAQPFKATGQQLTGGFAQGGEVPNQIGMSAILKENYKGKSKVGSHLAHYAKGGKTKSVDALVAPGEIYLPPKAAKEAKEGKRNPLKGEKIKGKAPIEGAVNDYRNDIVPKKLKAGGVILPNAVTKAADPHEAAQCFIAALKSKKGSK